MTDLRELIAQRGRVKTRITLFEKYLAPLLDSKLNKCQCNELNLRLNKFQDLSYSFEELQSKIESLDKDEDSQMQEREDVENRFEQKTLKFVHENGRRSKGYGCVSTPGW
ncbi:jg16243 [Pararge aegeria aegeria]|uniref:Jg16243 protein n=1 Tax=Pararge aegeria aegeria TaxID=348720 RepID=A0A8S4RWD9_9NEOP|nr:jg16243 [Pararge aegeria aegeria]